MVPYNIGAEFLGAPSIGNNENSADDRKSQHKTPRDERRQSHTF